MPLQHVSGPILSKVIEYCRYHVEATKPDSTVTPEQIDVWKTEFMQVDQGTLFELILVRRLAARSAAPFLSESAFLTPPAPKGCQLHGHQGSARPRVPDRGLTD